MPVHGALVGAATGGVPLPPISAGGGTSGPATSTGGAINIGGLFGGGRKSARSDSTLITTLVIGGFVLAAIFLFRR